MRIHEKIEKCVAFIALQLADGTFKYVGTVFFVGQNNKMPEFTCAVTARHVIEGIKSKGLEKVFIRLNITNGTTTIVVTNLSDWVYHQDSTVDLAILPCGLLPQHDHLFYPVSNFITDEVIKKNEMTYGDEVFISGLFVHHYGEQRNLPIVRIGTIAALPKEKISTNGTRRDAYLIESRSIGGLSGSPVFVNFGLIRKFDGQIKNMMGEDIHHLLGVVYGHYDSEKDDIDHIDDKNKKVNIGIAIVTPATKLLELIEQENSKLTAI